MDDKYKAVFMEGIKGISAVFRGMSPPARIIRQDETFPPLLRKAFSSLSRGINLSLDEAEKLKAEAQETDDLGLLKSYVAAARINLLLGIVSLTGVRQSGPSNLLHMLNNPASYNPPMRRVNRGFSLSD